MLRIVSSPLDEMALVAAPATGAVAVVDATARAILEGLADGRDEHALAAACAEASGVTVADALGEVVALRRAWVGLATARRSTRSPAPPARSSRQPSLDTVCRVGSALVRLRIWPPRLAALLAAVTAHCRSEDDGGHDSDGISTLEAWRVGGRYLLFQNHRHLLTTDSLMLARSELLRWLVLVSHPERAWVAILHGSAVAGPNGAALLCGTSGAGKSTLTGFLLASGLDLVTDDYAPLEVGSQRLWPVPFGLSVKEGSWPLLAPHFPDLATTPVVRTRQRRQRYVRPLRMATEPQLARCLVFPLYQPGAGVELFALRPGEALALCARSGGWYENSRERLGEFTGWLARMPAYALSYGDTAGAVAAVRRLLAC